MKGIVPIVGWVILGLALLVSFGIDCTNVVQSGAIDFRNRITGVRLLEHGIDPYHYKWREPEPAAYCDPFNNLMVPVSKTTSTPTLLLLHLPLGERSDSFPQWNYRMAQWTWLVLQWLLLLGTLWLWLRHCTLAWQRWLLAFFVTGLTYTAAWRLHAERGQVYVLLLFVFAGWLALTLDAKRGNSFLAGFVAGFLVALRPPFLALLPFLVLHRRGQLLGAVVGLLVGVILPMLWEANCWPEYFSAMSTYADLYRDSGMNPPYQQPYPPQIDGLPLDTIASYVVIPYADFSAHGFLIAARAEPFPVGLVLLVVMVPFLLWTWFSRTQPVERLLVGLAAWMFLIDLFLPSYRNNYNDVLILNVLALRVIGAKRIPWGAWPCLAALPLGWYVYGMVPEQAAVINAASACFTLGALLFLFWPGSPVQRSAR